MQQLLIIPIYFKYSLFKIDWNYFCNYWNKNPYRICKKHFQKSESKEALYGDTWPLSAYLFAKALPIHENDTLYEIGSGTGRISFWLQKISNCQVVGIEKVPLFIKIAKKIQKKLNLKKVEFIEQDLLDVDYSKATLIYFYSSSFSDKVILELIKKWKSLEPGTRIITTSFSLPEYGSSDYRVIKAFNVSFPWGKCEVYLQEKIIMNSTKE